MIQNRKIFLFLLTVFLFFEILFISEARSRSLSEDEQLIRTGIGAFQDGLFDIAEKQFSLFLKSFPTHGKVYEVSYLLGKIYFRQARWKEARPFFLKISRENKIFEALDYTLFWMAHIDMKLGNFEMSRGWLLTLLKNYPKFEWMDYAYYLLGCLAFEIHQTDLAETSFKKVTLLSKRENLIRSSSFWLSMLSFKQGAFKEAILYLSPLKEGVRQGSRQEKETLFWLGEAQFKSGRFHEAKQTYQLFFDQFKSDPLLPHVYWRIGFCDYRLGNLKESLDTFKTVQNLFKDHPLSVETHFLVGEILFQLGDNSTSIKELTPILQTSQPHPLGGPALLLLYWNHIHLNEREEAFRTFQRLLKFNAQEEEKIYVQWLVAQGLFAEGKVQDALPYYFSILNSKIRERVLFQIGKAYFFENKFREALTNLDLLFLEFPDSKSLGEGLLIKAECLLRLGETPQALETYRQILALSPKSPWVLMALTQIGLRSLFLGEKERAETTFKRILEDFPNHPLFFHAAFQLGNLYGEKMDFPGASQSYTLVLKGPVPQLTGPTYFRIGEILIQQEKEEKALNSFEAALQSLSQNSLWFGMTQLEIGNLQRRWGKDKEAKKSYRLVYNQSKNEEIKNAAKELLERLETR